MRKITVFILAAILIMSVLASCGQETQAPDGMQPVSNKTSDYNLYVPNEWIVDLEAGAVGAYFSQTDPTSVSVMSWVIEDASTTIDSWWEKSLTDLGLVFDDIALEDESNAILGGIAAKQYVYTANLGENSYKFVQIAAVKNSTLYLMTYTSTPQNFESHKEDLAKITESFKFN